MIFISMTDGRCIELTKEQLEMVIKGTTGMSGRLSTSLREGTTLFHKNIVGIYTDKTKFVNPDLIGVDEIQLVSQPDLFDKEEYSDEPAGYSTSEPEEKTEENCTHGNAGPHYKLDKNDRKFYVLYCPDCKLELKRAKIVDIKNLESVPELIRT